MTSATVETATGAIATDHLGTTLMHEHVFTLNAEIRANYPWDEERMVAEAVSQLVELKGRGVSTIVDLTVYGLGRDLPRVARIAHASGMQVVVATGVYTFRDMPTHFKHNESMTPGYIEELLVREVVEGVADTGIRPSIFKFASDVHGITEDIEVIIRSVARAHRRTGAPISTHAHGGSEQGIAQQELLAAEGVDLSRVIVGHVGDVEDLSYAERLIERGSYVGLDRFGMNLEGPRSDDPSGVHRRMEIAAELCKRGHASRLVLGHDTNVESDTTSRAHRAGLPGLQDWKYTHISDVVVPTLLDLGVTQADVDQMLVGNPRDIFSRVAAY